MKIKKAIIPVAGFGTRLLPITKALPKAMLPIVDKPVIHYLVEEAVASGIEEIVIVTGQDRRGIENYFNRSKELEDRLAKTGKYEMLEMIEKLSKLADISYITQKRPLGLGHAIYCGRKFIGKEEMFAVLLGDDIICSEKKPCLAQLINIYTEYNANVIAVQYVPNELVEYYGIVKGKNLTNKLIEVEDLIEKPNMQNTPSNLAIMGRYIISSCIFNILRDTAPGKSGEIQLTDALRVLNRTQRIYGYIYEGTRYDIGDKLGYLKANVEFALQKETMKKDLKEYLYNILDNKK